MRMYGGAGIGTMTILASPAIAPGDVMAVAPDAIASATGSVPEMRASKESVLHFENGEPVNIAEVSRSMFQTDCTAL